MAEILPKRKSNRLDHYDYSQNGLYFITSCAANERMVFSELKAKNSLSDPCEIVLTGLGKLIDEALEAMPSKYDGVFVDKYVIMPDHVHILLRLERLPACGRCP